MPTDPSVTTKPTVGDRRTGSMVAASSQSQPYNPVGWNEIAAAQPASMPLHVNEGAGSAAVSAVTYDGSGRVSSYTRNGVTVAVTYPTSTKVVLTPNDGSAAKTVTLDGSARVLAIN